MLETLFFQHSEINHGYNNQQTVEYALFLESLGHDNLIWQKGYFSRRLWPEWRQGGKIVWIDVLSFSQYIPRNGTPDSEILPSQLKKGWQCNSIPTHLMIQVGWMTLCHIEMRTLHDFGLLKLFLVLEMAHMDFYLFTTYFLPPPPCFAWVSLRIAYSTSFS